MTDEELAEIRAHAEAAHRHDACSCAFHADYQRDVPVLAAEVERLRTELTRLRTHGDDQALRGLELAVQNNALREALGAVLELDEYDANWLAVRTRARALLEGMRTSE